MSQVIPFSEISESQQLYLTAAENLPAEPCSLHFTGVNSADSHSALPHRGPELFHRSTWANRGKQAQTPTTQLRPESSSLAPDPERTANNCLLCFVIVFCCVYWFDKGQDRTKQDWDIVWRQIPAWHKQATELDSQHCLPSHGNHHHPQKEKDLTTVSLCKPRLAWNSVGSLGRL